MRFLLVGLWIAGSIFAAPSATIIGSTQTQAVLQIRGYSGACTIAVSELAGLSPLHPDFDPSLHSGSSTDTGRADTITWADGTRVVTVGHMNGDRALATATAYYWQVSGCMPTLTGSFTTPTLSNGASQQWPVPFDSSKPWNFDYPPVNLLDPTWMVDPITGIKLRPLNSARDRTWRTGGGANPPASGFTAFQAFGGGTSWTNPANVLNGSTSTASTTNTNPIDLYGIYNRFTFDTADAGFLGYSFDDVGVPLWGSATSQTGSNNQISVCVFTSPADGCLGTPVIVTLTGTTLAPAVPSASSDPDHPWPNNFPTPFFNGWGLTAPLGPDHVDTQGTLDCVAGVCTVTAFAPSSNFPSTMAVGQRVHIANSDPTCANDLCTMASYQNVGQITLAESLTTMSSQAYAVYMWGIRIAKVTATGTAVIGAAFKHAGSIAVGQKDASPFLINPHGFTSGDGHFGYLVEVPSQTSFTNFAAMYFVSGDGISRSLWNNIIWSSATCYASANSNDLPVFGGKFSGQASPDVTDARTWYINADNGAGNKSLFKLRYTGDTTEDLNTGYTYAQSGDGPIIANAPCGGWQITNLMPPSTSHDIVSQVAAWPGWSALFTTLYGNTGGSWTFVGTTGGFAFFQNSYGQQNNPAWLAQVNLSTGLLVNMIHTFDGTGTRTYDNSGIRWGGHHTTMPNVFTPAVLFVEDPLGRGLSVSALFSGPHEATPIGKLGPDGVTYLANTSLPWPADSSYFSACPVGNPYVFMGATGSNCVTLKFPVGGVCNVDAQALEIAHFPDCPWHSGWTQPLALAVGDNFTDIAKDGGTSDSGDSEHLRIVSVQNLSDGVKVVAQRNAIYDHCSFNPTFFPTIPPNTINNSAKTPGDTTDFVHLDAFTVMMQPSRLNGCNAANFFLDPVTGSVVENGGVLQGHGDLAGGSVGSTVSWLASNDSIPNKAYSDMFQLPTTFVSQAGPVFRDLSAAIGGGVVQSYPTAPGGVPWMLDGNSLNGNGGGAPEGGNSLGAVTYAHITGDVYTITPLSQGAIGSNYYKNHPLLGWAGRYLLTDVSGPASNIDTHPYGICYALVNDECHAGSTANSAVAYINVPRAYTGANVCFNGISWLLEPCVITGYPGGGAHRQTRITSPDPTGQASRFLSYGGTTPGELYPFAGIVTAPDGSFALTSAHHFQGWSTMAWILKLPPWHEDAQNRAQYVQIPVKIPAGALYAEIQFGYSRFIGAGLTPVGNPFCTSRREGCNTSADVAGGVPYNFAGEMRTLTTCTNGCTISIPVMAPNLVYYRVGRSTDGSTFTYGETLPLLVP